MGVIYRAHDPDIGRTVAIKLVRADLLEGEERENYLARFRHEAQAAGRCTHANIVAIYDFAMHEGNPFLAMEFVDGVPLGAALRSVGRFPPSVAVGLILQVLDALNVAHGFGVVHRDIKPGNILLRADGQVKVTDFGISRIDTSEMTQSGTVIGTPAYMAPEQCRGEPIDPRADLFSTGAVLHELLAGTRPFAGQSAAEVIHEVLAVEPPDLATIVPGVPPPLVDALRRAMAKDRAARFASAPEMAEALRAAIRDAAAADLAATDAGTIVVPRQPQPSAAAVSAAVPFAGAPFDDATIDTIERRLAHYVGPIARHLVRDAARRSASLVALRETLATHIRDPAERLRFLGDDPGVTATRAGSSRSGMTHTSASGSHGHAMASGPLPVSALVSPEQIERTERALARHVGPIARVLVRRALPGARSAAELWDRVAAHIDKAADRDAFLRQRPS
jgi:eukaryotic-like serine/threonine-protein kinase